VIAIQVHHNLQQVPSEMNFFGMKVGPQSWVVMSRDGGIEVGDVERSVAYWGAVGAMPAAVAREAAAMLACVRQSGMSLTDFARSLI